MHKSPVFYAIPFFLLLVAIEAIYGIVKKRKLYRLNDTITNISLGIGSQVAGALFKSVLLALYIYIHQHFVLYKLPVTWWSFILCLVLFDFLFYWAHRISHVSNFFWGAHVVHHQSEEYNLSVALRQSWIHNLIAFFIFLPIPFLGFDPITFGIAAGIDSVYQFWIHTRTIGKLHPMVEYIFNTPSHHRVHHAINPRYLDKNYAGVFIIWDRIFGSFIEEENPEEITYGITTQLKSWNPLWANWHYYHEMWQKATDMKTWKDKLCIIFAKPGWLPDYLGGIQIPLEVDRATYSKYDADTDSFFKIYGTAQFIIVLAGSIAYLDHFSTITLFYKWFFAAVLLVSIMIIGAIFERRSWIPWAEILRLVLVLASLNSYYFYWYSHWLIVTASISVVLFVLSLVGFAISISKNREQEIAS